MMVKISNKHNLKQIWSKEAKNYRAETDQNPDYLAHFETMEKTIGKLKGKTVLDLGSGTGISSAYLARKGARVTLVDISNEALKFAKKYFLNQGLTGRFIKQDIFRLKQPKMFFDVVWNGGVIEHFPDKQKIEMIRIMWRHLKPGGVLLITAPSALDVPFMAAKQLLLLRKKWAFGPEDDLTEHRLKKLAEKAGVENGITFCYNPIVGWWFFPYGREITNLLGLNIPEVHKIRSVFGHNVIFKAIKKAQNNNNK